MWGFPSDGMWLWAGSKDSNGSWWLESWRARGHSGEVGEGEGLELDHVGP